MKLLRYFGTGKAARKRCAVLCLPSIVVAAVTTVVMVVVVMVVVVMVVVGYIGPGEFSNIFSFRALEEAHAPQSVRLNDMAP